MVEITKMSSISVDYTLKTAVDDHVQVTRKDSTLNTARSIFPGISLNRMKKQKKCGRGTTKSISCLQSAITQFNPTSVATKAKDKNDMKQVKLLNNCEMQVRYFIFKCWRRGRYEIILNPNHTKFRLVNQVNERSHHRSIKLLKCNNILVIFLLLFDLIFYFR